MNRVIEQYSRTIQIMFYNFFRSKVQTEVQAIHGMNLGYKKWIFLYVAVFTLVLMQLS